MNYFCWHDWSEWSDATDTGYTYNKRQFRVCQKCNKIKSRILRLGCESVPSTIINQLITKVNELYKIKK